MIRTSHKQPGFIAALLHRLSGVALAAFLPMHFLALSTSLRGAEAFDSFLTATNNLFFKAAELGLVLALAMHLTLGLRVLVVEWLPWRERTLATVALCLGAAFAVGLVFLLNLA